MVVQKAAAHTPSWERAVSDDDGGRLSPIATCLLKLGRPFVDQGRAEKDEEQSSAKFAEFFYLLPAARDCRDKVIVEIGGGLGELSRYFSDNGAARVFCVEPNPEWHSRAVQACSGHASVEVLKAFGQSLPIADSSVDTVVLHDVIEHVDDPRAILVEAQRVLRPGGEVLIYFMPYYAPFGGHTWRFFPVPWAHAIYGQKVLAEMRSHVSGWHTKILAATGLYKVSLRGFEKCIESAPLRVVELNLVGIKKQSWLTRVPLLREACTAIVAARLRKDLSD